MSLDETMAFNDVQTTLVAVANKTDHWELTTRWCRILRTLWSHRLRKKIQNLIFTDMVRVRGLVDVTTGHCMIAHMSACMIYRGNDFYRICLDEDEGQFIKHLLFDCLALN